MCCGILHQHPQILPNTAFRPKIKILKFGTKIALIGYFGLEFQKTSVVFEISILEFLKMQSFIQKQKKLYIFGLQFNKSYYQIFNQHLRICETINFHPKQKKNKLGTKKTLFGSLGWNVENLLSYLYSTPSNLSNCNVWCKN